MRADQMQTEEDDEQRVGQIGKGEAPVGDDQQDGVDEHQQIFQQPVAAIKGAIAVSTQSRSSHRIRTCRKRLRPNVGGDTEPPVDEAGSDYVPA